MERLISNVLYLAPQLRRPGVYLVGGAVRDHKLGLQPKDFDIVVEGNAISLAYDVKKTIAGAHAVHNSNMGTATVWSKGWKLDFAITRTETYPKPGKLPNVKLGAPIEEDLHRRDFTVNAMAVSLFDFHEVEVPGASYDMEHELIRVLHNRSFIDDPTRMLRALRYIGKTGFKLEPATASMINFDLLDAVSTGRLMKEFR